MTLAEWIKETGLTRAEIARRYGTTPGHIKDLCENRFWPSKTTVLKILRFTEGAVTPNDFLPEKELKLISRHHET